MSQEQVSPEQKLRDLYEQSEKRWSRTAEQLVGSRSFAEGLALLTSNAVAMTRVWQIGVDQVVRASRLAGRNDITRLGRQLNRTEDKLEQVLQIVEELEAELAATRAERDAARTDGGGIGGEARP